MNFFVKKFYREMEKDVFFRRKLLAAKAKYNYIKEPKDKLCIIIESIILPEAERKGYNFDIYDLLIFEEEASFAGAHLLDEENLAKVSGGSKRREVLSITELLGYQNPLGELATYWYEKNN